MNSKILIGLVVLSVGVGVGWYVLQGNKVTKQESTETQEVGKSMPVPESPAVTEKVVETTGGNGQAMEKGGVPGGEKGSVMTKAAVSYTDSGFTPNTITVKKGTTVTFTNQSTKGMWVASAVHPTHQLLPGFDQLKSVAKGGTYEYAFDKVGTWKYHMHRNPSDTGSVVVTE